MEFLLHPLPAPRFATAPKGFAPQVVEKRHLVIHHRTVPWSPGRVFAVGEVSGDAKISFDFQTSNTSNKYYGNMGLQKDKFQRSIWEVYKLQNRPRIKKLHLAPNKLNPTSFFLLARINGK